MFDRPIPHFLEQYIGKPDETVEGWPGLDNPSIVVLLYLGYGLILSYGKRRMKSASPFGLGGILVCYNLVQITMNAYILAEVLACVSTGMFSPFCGRSQRLEPANTRLARAVWLFYLNKMIDLMDTVFFVLRKKNEQITFLHVYHHLAMLMAWYLGALYTPGGQAWPSVAINAGIHVMMYLYYLISALGSSYRKYLWWKKYLTQIQLVQFIVVGSQVAYLLYRGCARPRWLAHVAFFYNLTLIVLFLGFYRKAYGKPNRKRIMSGNHSKARESDAKWIVRQDEGKKRS